MKIKHLITLLRLSSAATYAADNPPWQVPIPKTAAEVPGPVPGNTMTYRLRPVVWKMQNEIKFSVACGTSARIVLHEEVRPSEIELVK